MTPVNLIGGGRIASAVADWLHTSDRYTLRSVIGRGGGWSPAPLTIDAAGPGALRDHGAALLAEGDLWSVGAAALVDDDVRGRLLDTAIRHGHELRLFTGWIAGPALAPAGTAVTLHVDQHEPHLGPAPGLVFAGPLREAASRYPGSLNAATAAALAGPGIEATTVALHSTGPGGAHFIHARVHMPGQIVVTSVRFGEGPHPVAQAIMAALEARGAGLRYG